MPTTQPLHCMRCVIAMRAALVRQGYRVGLLFKPFTVPAANRLYQDAIGQIGASQEAMAATIKTARPAYSRAKKSVMPTLCNSGQLK